MATQNEMILDALMDGRRLTPLDALRDFGCFRLGARIHELRAQGYDIESEYVAVRGRIGGKCSVKAYWLA